MRVAILGTGDVGRTLARAFRETGHDVVVGTRDPSAPHAAELLRALGPGARLETFSRAVDGADVVVLAVLGSSAEEVVRQVTPEALAGKILIDTTNPLVFHDAGPPTLFVGHTDSLGERLQRAAPRARVVKAFNTIGHTLMFRPVVPGGPPDVFLCGEDARSKAVVADLLRSFGLGAVDAGGISASRELEALCLLWVRLYVARGRGDHAFKLLVGAPD